MGSGSMGRRSTVRLGAKMTNISGMDYNNTSFNIERRMVTGNDAPESIANPFYTANRRNLDQIVKQINTNSREAKKSLNALTDEVSLFVIDDDAETVVLTAEGIKRILTLAENLRIAFENLLKATE
jgi:predicted transcriptional regulator